MHKTALAILASAALVFAGACSSDDSDSTTTAAPDDSGTSALPPIEVDGAEDVTMKVGEFIRINTPDADKVSADDTDVLETQDAYSDGSADFVAGAEAVGDGKAVLSVYSGDELLYEVNVTVEG